MFFISFLSKIYNLGIDENTSDKTIRHIRVLNASCISLLVISISFALYSITINILLVVFSLMCALLCNFCLIFAYFQKVEISKILFIMGGIIICTVVPLLTGERDGAEHGHFAVVAVIFVLFTSKKNICILSFLSFCGFIIAKISFLYPPVFIIEETTLVDFQFIFSIIAIFFLNFFALMVFKVEHTKAEDATQDAYEEMKTLSEEINTQNEELRQQQEELVTQRDYLARQAKTLEIQTEKLLIGQKEMALANNEVQFMLNQVQKQKKDLELRSSDIMQSIVYAERIQAAILPTKQDISLVLPNNFLFTRARNIVSGDFYWINTKIQNNVIVTVADCTGHGVPAAILSMLGVNLLNQIVLEHKIYDPATILRELDRLMRYQLKQEIYKIGELQDGMEMALCRVDKSNKTLYYATAKRSIYLLRNNEIIVLKGNKQPIGGSFYEHKTFQTFEIALETDDMIYMFTDGFTDQFNAKNDEKYTTMRLKDLLVRIKNTSLKYQEEIIATAFDEWKGYTEQTDDILMLGFKPLM